MIVGKWGKPDTPTFGKDKSAMTPEQQAKLDTFYLYDLKVTKSDSDLINEGTTYEYSCPKSYHKDVSKETDTGEKRTIKGLRSMFSAHSI